MRTGLGVFAWAASMALSGWAHAQCTKDTDCKGDRVCDAGQCVSPQPLPPAPPPPTDAPPPPTDAPPTTDAPAAPAPGPGPTMPPIAPAEAEPHSTAVEPAEPIWRRRSKGAMAGGIVMTSIGPLVAIGGGALLDGASQYCGSPYSYDGVNRDADAYEDCVDGREALGYVVLVSGIAILAVGVPLIVWGAKRERISEEPEGSISTWVSPGSAGLRLRLSL